MASAALEVKMKSNGSDPNTTTAHGDSQAYYPHERLDVYRVLDEAYERVTSWPISFAKGTTGDQLERAAGSALLRYAEGFYAQGGSQATHWVAARASCGEAGAAVMRLVRRRQVGALDAEAARVLFARAMSMLYRLTRRS